ncbi:hypothetical protein EC845_0748 [Comamonas sp. BIGb0124]|nr:hypothetical protein EC845_0748 [Comamonas sp. BIGb0124]
MDVDQTVARREADEARVRARLSAHSAEPEGRVFGLTGIEMFDANFSGDLPPAPRRV